MVSGDGMRRRETGAGDGNMQLAHRGRTGLDRPSDCGRRRIPGDRLNGWLGGKGDQFVAQALDG